MPSPFPGMDPWLERPGLFPSLHNGLIFLLQEALNAGLPAGYAATTDNRIWIDTESRREPDVGILSADDLPIGSHDGFSATLTAAGLIAVPAAASADPFEEPFLEVRTDEGDRLVTAIEIVSPTNKKPGSEGRGTYRQKQAEYRAAGVNVVELDLLRGGGHVTLVPAARLRALAGNWDYHWSVTTHAPEFRYYARPFRLADRLPPLAVPLDAGLPPTLVEVQPLFDRCYDASKYAVLAKYDRRAPDPPLTAEQQAWADEILRKRGA